MSRPRRVPTPSAARRPRLRRALPIIVAGVLFAVGVIDPVDGSLLDELTTDVPVEHSG